MIVRVIPRLDIKGPNLVKGVMLEGLRVLGKPEAFARAYYEAGADELLFVDVVASLYERNSLAEIIARTAREVFIPLTVAGGIRSLDDIRAALRAGADKVAINTAAHRRPELIREASRRYGASTIVVSIEAIRLPDGRYEAFTDNGREKTGRDPVAWAEQVAELGAGELLVTSVDREGTGRGYDVELLARIAERVGIPVVASGGAGSAQDVVEVMDVTAAAAVASVLHYDLLPRLQADPTAFDASINLAHLGRPGFARIAPASLAELKQQCTARGWTSRPVPVPEAVRAA
jgi:cyclase